MRDVFLRIKPGGVCVCYVYLPVFCYGFPSRLDLYCGIGYAYASFCLGIKVRSPLELVHFGAVGVV